MKRTKLFLSAFVFFATLNTAKAQIDMESLLTNFVDTTELMVNNGRRMMIQHVQAGDFQGVAELYELLNERTRAKNCDAFLYNESLLIAILTENWKEFLRKAENFSEIVRTPICYPIRDQQLFFALRSDFHANSSNFFNSAMKAGLTDEEKEVVELFFYIVRHGQDENFDRKIRAFKRNHPRSRFSDFVENYLPSPEQRIAMAFGLGGAGIFPTGSLKDYFAPIPAFAISLDFYVNNFFFGLLANGGNMKLATPLLNDVTRYERDLPKNERFMYRDVGLAVGYIVAQNSWLQFSPYVNLGRTNIRTNFHSGQENDLEFKISDSFFIGPGLRTEVKLFGFRATDQMIDEPSSINLRFDVGYNFPATYQFPQARGNVFYARLSLVWWLGKF